MKSLKFKTNIKCEGCIAKITPALNEEKGISKWEVDIASPDKILTVETQNLDIQKIINLLERSGFEAQLLTA